MYGRLKCGEPIGLALIPGYLVRDISAASGNYSSGQLRTRVWFIVARDTDNAQLDAVVHLVLTAFPNTHERLNIDELIDYVNALPLGVPSHLPNTLNGRSWKDA